MTEDWTSEAQDARPLETPRADPQAWARTVSALGDVVEAAREVGRDAVAGAQDRLESLDATAVVSMVALLQDVRRDLAAVEADLARLLGRDDTAPRDGALPDGRRWEVRKGATRRAWDHPGWQHDARQRVALGAAERYPAGLVDPATGEQVTVAALLQPALAAVQAVHGSSAPRVTALRSLGLSPEDYSETSPGPWGVQVTTVEQ